MSRMRTLLAILCLSIVAGCGSSPANGDGHPETGSAASGPYVSSGAGHVAK